MGRVISFDELKQLRSRHADQKIVHCHGVFDLFHSGHLQHLREASSFGDLLVVTITPDRFVNKGPHRPRFTEKKRAEMLAALQLVDYVSINITSRAVEPIEALRPHFYVKGPDYRDKQADITGGILDEEQAILSVGGQLVFTADETESATELINQFFHNWDDEQQQTLARLRDELGLSHILGIVEGLSELRVLVVGEPIVDTYVFCQPENLSSKSPSISANFLRDENYAGGAWAVARHLDALGCKVELLAPRGTEDWSSNAEEETLSTTNVKNLPCYAPELPTPRKIRYIAPFMNQRMFELTHLDAKSWSQANLHTYSEQLLKAANRADVVLALDFGHGLWDGERLNLLEKVNSFKALNVQTNSGNYGYNFFQKHRNFDYLVLDERELRLGMHDRFSPIHELAQRAFTSTIKKTFSVTLGKDGSRFLDEGGRAWEAPTYFEDPIDTTGAGDAFFAMTALLAYLKVDPQLIPFVGNLFAGLKTKIIGNKSAVSKIDLIRSINALLK